MFICRIPASSLFCLVSSAEMKVQASWTQNAEEYLYIIYINISKKMTEMCSWAVEMSVVALQSVCDVLIPLRIFLLHWNLHLSCSTNLPNIGTFKFQDQIKYSANINLKVKKTSWVLKTFQLRSPTSKSNESSHWQKLIQLSCENNPQNKTTLKKAKTVDQRL